MKILEGKRALVCGVANAKSIAWGVAQCLHEQGAQVAMTCVEGARRRVQKLAAEIGSGDLVFSCDVTHDDDIQRAIHEAGEALGGKIDTLVHSIAYARLEDLGGEFLKVTRDGWRLALEISAYSLVAMARAARPYLLAAGGGSVLTLTFSGSTRVVPAYNVMGVCKAALESSMRYLAYDLGPDKIRVNALSPAMIATMSSVVIDQFDAAMEDFRKTCPMLECVSPRDVGNAVAFYSSDLSSRITGTVLYIDSGAEILCPSAKKHPRSTAT